MWGDGCVNQLYQYNHSEIYTNIKPSHVHLKLIQYVSYIMIKMVKFKQIWTSIKEKRRIIRQESARYIPWKSAPFPEQGKPENCPSSPSPQHK